MSSFTVPQIENNGDQLVVTSETIAEGTGGDHRAILQLIKNNQGDFEQFGRVSFEMRPFETPGGRQEKRVALLNEQQATLLVTFSRNTDQVKAFKVTLVKAFYEMAHQLQRPKTLEERSRELLGELDAKVQEQQRELDTARPKAQYVDEFVADNDSLLFRTVASNLEIGEQQLRDLLLYSGWIYRESQRRRNSKGKLVTEYRWSEYAHKKPYFQRIVNHEAPLFKGSVAHTLKITSPGASAISSLVKRTVNDYGSIDQALPVLKSHWEAKQNKRQLDQRGWTQKEIAS